MLRAGGLTVSKQLAFAALVIAVYAYTLPIDAKVVETTVEVPVEVTGAQGQILRPPIRCRNEWQLKV